MTMCITLILVMLVFTKTFILGRDASMHGIGAMFMQEGRRVAFERCVGICNDDLCGIIVNNYIHIQ